MVLKSLMYMIDTNTSEMILWHVGLNKQERNYCACFVMAANTCIMSETMAVLLCFLLI